MKRTLVLVFGGLAAAAAFAGLVHFVLVAAHVSEPATITVRGATVRRIWATVVVVPGLSGAVIGILAVVRPAGRFGRAAGRLGTVIAIVAGLIAIVNGALLLALANGGPGTGNGVVGAAAALVLGLVAVGSAFLALRRARRSVSASIQN